MYVHDMRNNRWKRKKEIFELSHVYVGTYELNYRENNSIQVCVRSLNRRDNIHFSPEKMIYELYIVVRTAKISNFGQIN